MTRKEYIDKLGSLLKDLEEAEKNDAISYYEDYFDEAGLADEDEVMESVDAPEKVADNILAGMQKDASEQGIFTENGYQTFESAKSNELVEKKLRNQRNGVIIAAIILGVLALPILMPIFGGVLGIVISVVCGFLALLFGVLCVGISLFLAGGVLVFLAITQIFSYPAAGIMLVGVAILLLAVGAVLTALGVWIVSKLVPIIADWIKSLFTKKSSKKGVHA